MYKPLFIHVPRTGGTTIRTHMGGSIERIGHFTASTLKKRAGDDKWNKIYSFGFVRNPYIRAVSWWKHCRKNFYKKDFKTYINTWVSLIDDRHSKDARYRDNLTQKTYLCTDDGHVLVDHVAKYEDFDHEMEYLCDVLGKTNGWGHLNGHKEYDYQSYYDDDTVDIVTKRCKWEIEKYEYSFLAD